MTSLDTLKVLVRLSLRSITSHKVKSLIVGGILAFGTFLLVLTTTFLNNLTSEMEHAVTGALIGNAQVYSSDAKDKLAFFGGFGQTPDIGRIHDFPKVRKALLTIPNVRAVVPMGRGQAAAEGGNVLDDKLGELRDTVEKNDQAKIPGLEARVRQLAGLLKQDYLGRKELSSNTQELDKDLAVIDRAMSDAFWADFQTNPLNDLDWLDENLAPLQADSAQLYLSYLGTDLDAFARDFSKFAIVQGTMVPKGHRGILLSKEFYDRQAKNLVARELDTIRDARNKDHKTIATDTVLQETVRNMQKQSAKLVYEMDPEQSVACAKELRAYFGPQAKGDLKELLRQLLKIDDQNFDARDREFYRVVAPKIQLYSIKVGGILTLQAMSKSGYSHATNIKVYGIFHFKGLDDSILASAYNLVDMMTFRDLYGLMTPAKLKELQALKKEVGVKDVSEKDAEADLFGSGDSTALVTTGTAADIKDTQPVVHAKVANDKPFTQADIDDGVVLNAAILLKNGTQLYRTMQQITQLSAKDHLGIQVVDWKSAAGMIGKIIGALTIVLVVSFVVIFIVSLAIINNSMLMSMMDRVIEIGTMRAIGAQRRFVLAMFLLESAVLSAGAALFGILGADLVAHAMSAKGWPAAGTNMILLVLFGGPHLHPHVTAMAVAVGAVCIALVSFIATLYPAYTAAHVQPVVAMQRRE